MKIFYIATLLSVLPFLESFASDCFLKSNNIHRVIISHEYYWETFTLTKESPTSPDGDFQLKKVNRNGSVELLELDSEGEHDAFIIKPALKKPKPGMEVQTFIVIASNSKTQTATIKMLKIKSTAQTNHSKPCASESKP